MAAIKSYTDLEQSKKLAEILPIESADMWFANGIYLMKTSEEPKDIKGVFHCWSLAALIKYLSEIKPQVYTPILFPSENKWILQFAEYGYGNVCEVSCGNPVDACYEIIIKLSELNLL